jgi:hypothetical protein
MTRLVTRPLGRRFQFAHLAALLGALVMVLPARSVHALGADEWAAALQVGGTLIRAPGTTAPGMLLGVDVAGGITDVLAAHGSVALAGFDWPESGSPSPNPVIVVGAGGLAAFDVLQVVPSVELDLVAAFFGEGLGPRLGVELGLGADYLLDRHVFLGIALRGRVLPLALDGPAAVVPSGTALARLGYRF